VLLTPKLQNALGRRLILGRLQRPQDPQYDPAETYGLKPFPNLWKGTGADERERYLVCGDDTNLSLSQDMEVVVGSRCNSSVHFAIGISGLTVGERTYAARYSASFVPSGRGID
jgi:hypothetical protein